MEQLSAGSKRSREERNVEERTGQDRRGEGYNAAGDVAYAKRKIENSLLETFHLPYINSALMLACFTHFFR